MKNLFFNSEKSTNLVYSIIQNPPYLLRLLEANLANMCTSVQQIRCRLNVVNTYLNLHVPLEDFPLLLR